MYFISLGFDKCLTRKAKHESSENHLSYFHLGPLEGVIACPPGFPVDTFMARGGILVTIDAIKVRFHTLLVPPSSWAQYGTVSIRVVIIILIASCKWLTTVMMIKRVTCSSWIKKWLRPDKDDNEKKSVVWAIFATPMRCLEWGWWWSGGPPGINSLPNFQ